MKGILNLLLNWIGVVYLMLVSWDFFYNFTKSGGILLVLSAISAVILYFLLGILYSYRFLKENDGYCLAMSKDADVRDSAGVFWTAILSAIFGYSTNSIFVGFIIAVIVVFLIRATVMPKGS
jgi:hypothetical protein